MVLLFIIDSSYNPTNKSAKFLFFDLPLIIDVASFIGTLICKAWLYWLSIIDVFFDYSEIYDPKDDRANAYLLVAAPILTIV